MYFVVSDPDVDNSVLAVNMTTLRSLVRADKACILNIGDHPKIKHQSFIFYQKAIEVSAPEIMIRVSSKEYNMAERLSDETLKKIQEGAKKSEFLPEKFKKYFEYF
ncbi:hypothetical protein [Candidatus Endomicrobiellum agilis]|uniref:hypothetical protein n=1 Tax=Candidatus Endomicrobiellum agilis TaxID=3238957 RepID=UPI003578DF14|nr:hypothetical protein [Endomicrobium sp.]